MVTAWFISMGCSVPDAPEDLDQLSSYLFLQMANPDPAYMKAGVDNLIDWMGENRDDLNEGYRIENLSQDAIDTTDLPPADLQNLVGAAVATDIGHSVTDTLNTVLTVDPMVMSGDNFNFNERTFIGDLDCFLAEECNSIAYNAHQENKLPLGIEVESKIYGEYMWVESDAGKVIAQRRWMLEPGIVNNDWLRVEQEFGLTLYLPSSDGMTFVDLDWIITMLGDLEVPEDFALTLAINSIQKGRLGIEEFMDEQ